MSALKLDAIDKALINGLQGGFPLTPEPFRAVADDLGIAEDEAIERVRRLLDGGVLSRFGPLYHAEKMGGGLTLAAMRVPEADFARVAEIVNGYDEVSHNYARDDEFNMWFVVATERRERIPEVIAEIEERTGLAVIDLPKQEEFFIGLRLEA